MAQTVVAFDDNLISAKMDSTFDIYYGASPRMKHEEQFILKWLTL